MVRNLAVVAVLLTTSLAFPPVTSADPDPHIPNGEAGWCAGGQRPGNSGARYCLGEPFPDGTFYAQTWSFGPSGPFAPGAWRSGAICSQWIEGAVQGAFPGRGACGGGPQFFN